MNIEDRYLTPEQEKELDGLIDLLQYEKARPSSCTPDIVERFQRAFREHLEANEEA